MCKLIKDSSDNYSPVWNAEETKYFEKVYATKHYGYDVHYTLKDDAPKADCFYWTKKSYASGYSNNIRLLKDVKEYINGLDEMYIEALNEAVAERKAEDEKWAKRKNHEEALNVFTSKNSYLPDVGEFLDLKFANLNKNCTVGEYRYEVEKGDYRTENAKVEKVVTLSTEDYDAFALSLMDHHEFLGRGGSGSDDARLEHLEDVAYHEWTEEECEIYKGTYYNIVTAIVALGRETIYSDAQGHTYARYLAFA